MVTDLSGAIIAAGRGERLRAASGGIPKPLVELGGEALLVRQARALAALGARPVHAIVNSETAAMIRDRGSRCRPKSNSACAIPPIRWNRCSRWASGSCPAAF